MPTRSQRRLTIGLSVVYIIMLTWLILFKFVTNFKDLPQLRSINLVPFRESVIVNGRIDFDEIIYNILVFVPMGIFVCILKPNWTFIQKVLPEFIFSLIFEVLQYIFAIGASDITDVIGNTLGGVIGIGAFAVIEKMAKDKTIKIINILALICFILMSLLLIILTVANM